MQEAMILAAIIEQRDLESARKTGLSPEHFGNPRERAGYEFLLHYAETHDGDIPTQDIFLNRSGFTEWVDVPKGLGVGSLAEEIVRLSLARELESSLPDPLELRKDPHTVGRRVLDRFREVLVDHADRAITPVRMPMQELSELLSSGRPVPRGYPFPWESLTEASLGLMGSELTVIYGRPGTMKTWVLLSMLAHLMRTVTDLNIMLVSGELPLDLITRRLASLLSELPYEKVRQNNLSEDELGVFAGVVDLLAMGGEGEYASLYMVGSESMTGSEIERKVDLIRPDVLFIDSAYLEMDPKLDPEDRRSLAKGIKLLLRVSRNYKIPVVITLHASRKRGDQVGGAGGDDVYGSDVISQRVDILYRTYLYYDDDDKQKLLLQVAKSREFPLGGLIINPPVTGDYRELMLLRTSTAVEVELLKLANRGKKARKVTGMDSALEGYLKGTERK